MIRLAAAVVLLAACAKKDAPIAPGARVRFHYTLTVDGAPVDQSPKDKPLEYRQGAGMIVPGLEAQLAGHKAGDRFEAKVEAKDGYGERLPAAIKTIPYPVFGGRKKAQSLKPGDTVNGQANGRPFQAKVVALADDGVTLDLNHPLAGKPLTFAIEVVSVEPGAAP